MSVVECVLPPPVPVIVIVVGEKRVERALDATTVNVELELVGFGENEPLRPVVNPDAESDTGALNPFCAVIVTVYVLVEVFPISRDDGLTEIEKSADGADCTTRVADAECVVDPFVPVMVNG